MSILCALAGHEADRREAYNGGFRFSRCRRCGRDMIRSSGEWRAVPHGHRVAWKSGRHCHSLEPDFSRVLPVLHEQSNLPAVRSSFTSWSRQLARIGAKAAARKADRDPDAAEARENQPYPKLVVIAALIGVGLQFLFSLGGGRREPAWRS